ncbi:MAG: hypothetical protein ACK42L_07630, partial [Thermoanaerobaculum sp.]
ELFFPRLLGEPLGDATSGFWAAPSFPWQRYYPLLFVGAGTAALLCTGIRRGKGHRVWLWVLAFGVIVAFLPAWEPVRAFLIRLPGGQLARFAIKGLQLWLLAATPLVALGWEKRKNSHGRPWVLLGVALVLLIPGFFPEACRSALSVLYPASAPALQQVPEDLLRRGLLLDGLTNALPLLALAASRSTGLAVFALLAVQWPLFFATHVITPTQLWAEPPAAVQVLPQGAAIVSWAQAADPAPSPRARTLAFRNALLPDYGMAYGFSYVLARGPDGLEPILGELLAAYAEKMPPEKKLRLAAALGAQAVVSTEKIPGTACQKSDRVWVCPAPRFAPEVFLAQRVFPAETLEQAVAWLTAESFVPGADVTLAGIAAPQNTGGGQVREEPGPPHRRRFRVQAPQRTWLLVQQNHLSRWQAFVDGQPAPVVPANFAHLAIAVPAGDHRVELQLEASSNVLGALGPLLFCLTWFYWRSADRRAANGARERNTPATAPAP